MQACEIKTLDGTDCGTPTEAECPACGSPMCAACTGGIVKTITFGPTTNFRRVQRPSIVTPCCYMCSAEERIGTTLRDILTKAQTAFESDNDPSRGARLLDDLMDETSALSGEIQARKDAQRRRRVSMEATAS